MRYSHLATDYDGTLAHDGVVDEPTLAALHRAKAAGLHLLMVTGREIDDLARTFAHSELFEQIVGENGALIFTPATREHHLLAPSPPPELVDALRKQNVPISVGKSVVATVEPYEHIALEAIRQLGLEWHIIFNKGSVMILPSGVNKATGLTALLKQLKVSAQLVAGVGDAENDQAFLKMCGLGVAVANALPAVKETADFTTQGARGAGVTELINRIISDDLPNRAEKRRPTAPG